MKYDYIVLADADETVACPSELEAIKFIRERTDKDIIYSIYNEETGENIIFEEDFSMIITTKKVKCNGLRPTSDYLYSVAISDGKHAAIFISDGSSAISQNNYCDCQTKSVGDTVCNPERKNEGIARMETWRKHPEANGRYAALFRIMLCRNHQICRNWRIGIYGISTGKNAVLPAKRAGRGKHGSHWHK